MLALTGLRMLTIMATENEGGAKMKNDPYTQDVIEVFEQIMEGCDTNYSKTAALIENNGKPMSRQAVFKMVKQGSIKLSAFLRILDVLNVNVVFKKGNKVISVRMPKF